MAKLNLLGQRLHRRRRCEGSLSSWSSISGHLSTKWLLNHCTPNIINSSNRTRNPTKQNEIYKPMIFSNIKRKTKECWFYLIKKFSSLHKLTFFTSCLILKQNILVESILLRVKCTTWVNSKRRTRKCSTHV